jgi:hypothetical protein
MQGTNGASYAKVTLSVNDSLTLMIQAAQPERPQEAQKQLW